jgi:hypothetical protein
MRAFLFRQLRMRLSLARIVSLSPLRWQDWSTGLGWLIALGFSANLGADWFHRFSAPESIHPISRFNPDPQQTAQRVNQQQLFGQETKGNASGPQLEAARLNINLVAVVTGKRGFALLAEEGQSAQAFLPGMEVSQGFVLKTLAPDFVVLERNGERHRVALPEKRLEPQGATAARPTPSPNLTGPSESHHP